MNTSLLAAALTTGLMAQSAPTAAWYQWYKQDVPFSSAPNFLFYQSIPYGIPGTGPLLRQNSPWFWSYQPGLFYYWTMPGVPNATYVEQTQSPSGYHIRVHAPSWQLDSLQIGVEAGAIVIGSNVRTTASSPLQAQRMGWSTQWVTLPADANLAAMRMSWSETGIEIYVPRIP